MCSRTLNVMRDSRHVEDAAKPSLDNAVEEHELWLSGSKASRRGWVRVSDGTERVFYHSIGTGKITLERPEHFGTDEPTWADGAKVTAYVHCTAHSLTNNTHICPFAYLLVACSVTSAKKL